MNKKLLRQTMNEWHSNTWLVVELLLVSVLLWFVVDYIYFNIATYVRPMGFDITHCYNIQCSKLAPSSPDYIPADTSYYKSLKRITEKLRQRPDIEAACLSRQAYPYSSGGRWSPLSYDTLTTKGVRFCSIEPDFFKVFRCRGTNGETPEELAQILEKDPNGFLMSANNFKESGIKASSLVGKKFHFYNDSTTRHRLLALYEPIRACEFSIDTYSRSLMSRIDDHHFKSHNFTILSISVRVKPKHDIDFINRLSNEAQRSIRVGNLYISSIRSFSSERAYVLQAYKNELRNYFAGAGFLLLNIFLGLFGTFWFRTQQRRSEIALLKVIGATNRDIFGRQLSEGLLLLTIASIPAIIIDWNLAHAQLNLWLNDPNTLEPNRFIASTFITYLLMALTIFLGELLPAYKAMKLPPAETLHNE